MKSKWICAAVVACSVLVSPSAMAAKGKQYILGVNLTFLSVKPTGETVVSRGTTNADGQIEFDAPASGKYLIVIDGPTLAAAMDKLLVIDGAPEAETKSSGPSFSVGGNLFGGSSRSSGHEGERGHSRSSSGGGVGLGISVPLGHGNDPPANQETPDIKKPIIFGLELATGSQIISTETAYCRDTAAQGMRLGFTMPEGATDNKILVIIKRDGRR